MNNSIALSSSFLSYDILLCPQVDALFIDVAGLAFIIDSAAPW